MSVKRVKAISGVDNHDLERALNIFFMVGDSRWTIKAVTSGPGYRTAWLEFDPSDEE